MLPFDQAGLNCVDIPEKVVSILVLYALIQVICELVHLLELLDIEGSEVQDKSLVLIEQIPMNVQFLDELF